MKNIYFRLYLLVFITTLPFILFTSYNHYQLIKSQKDQELDRLTEIAKLTASEHKQITEGARQLLIALASTPQVQTGTPSTCSAFLSNVKTNYVRYINFGVVDLEDHLICAADVSQASLNLPLKTLLSNTINSHSFTIGTYYPISPDLAVINFAYPLSHNRIVYASLSLDWVTDFVHNLNYSSDIVTNILDKNGTVLARNPDTGNAQGQNFATDPLVQEILRQGSGATTKVGIDNITRLYSFRVLDDTRSTYIAVGIPESKIYSEVRNSFYVSLISIVAIAIISFFLAYQIGRLLIIKQLESLQKIDQLKDEFVSLASHQLRAPMTAIRWLTESLLESKEIPSKELKTIKRINVTNLRLIELTTSLLHISRIEADTLKIHATSIKLSQVVHAIIQEFTPLTSTKKLVIKTKIPTNLQLIADPNLIGETIRIILGNSIKYSKNGTSILVRINQSNQVTTIKIIDHGIGIPKNIQPLLFTRFYRADNARDFDPDGNGLGLYLAKLITQKIGGSITFVSNQAGTTFTLTLPNKV